VKTPDRGVFRRGGRNSSRWNREPGIVPLAMETRPRNIKRSHHQIRRSFVVLQNGTPQDDSLGGAAPCLAGQIFFCACRPEGRLYENHPARRLLIAPDFRPALRR
jgi:hypothetical protein